MINHQTPLFVGVLSVLHGQKDMPNPRNTVAMVSEAFPTGGVSRVALHPAICSTQVLPGTLAPILISFPWFSLLTVAIFRRTRWIGKEKCGFKEVEGNFVTGHHGFFL